jgi:hypothetical protein
MAHNGAKLPPVATLPMVESQHELLTILLADRRISPAAISELSAFFSSLSDEEKSEVFKAKAGLFKPTIRKAREVDDKPPAHIVDFASFLIAIDMSKRPSHYKNRKFEGEIIPDFLEAKMQSGRKRRSQKEAIIKTHYMDKIEQWQDQGIGWRKIAEGLKNAPLQVSISATHLRRIFYKIIDEREKAEFQKNIEMEYMIDEHE